MESVPLGVKASDLNSSLRWGRDGMVSKLQSTVKTHKLPGKVVLRPIQNASHNPFGGLGSWVNFDLNKQLDEFPHLVHSGEAFVKRVTSTKFPSNIWFLHYDLDDFFLKGSFEFLKHHCSLITPLEIRKVMRESLDFLLQRQYVASSHVDNGGEGRDRFLGLAIGMQAVFQMPLFYILVSCVAWESLVKLSRPKITYYNTRDMWTTVILLYRLTTPTTLLSLMIWAL